MHPAFVRTIGLGTLLGVLGVSVVAPDRLSAEEAKDVLQAVRGTLQPWRALEEAWVGDATMIFRSTYHHARLPCIHIGDSWAMPMGAEFQVTKVLKGGVRFTSIILESRSPQGGRFPSALVEDRSYLVFLKPGPQTAERMREKEVTWVLLTEEAEEVVAIVDLSQSKAEADALTVQATKSGIFEGFQFTPERWESLRAAKTIDLGSQRELVPFLVNVVLADKPTLASVRSYLGEPDYFDISPGRYECHYDFQRTEEVAEDGQVSGKLEITFRGDLTLDKYQIEFYRCKIESGRDFSVVSWSALSDEEHKGLRLPHIQRLSKPNGDEPANDQCSAGQK